MSLHATTSQTVGPYLHIGLTWLITEKLAPAGVPGERVSIEGRVLDGDGKPVNDALVEIWQADSRGKIRRQALPRLRPLGDRRATARSASTPSSPDACRDRGGKLQAPHILVNVFMRGQLKQLVSRIYFPGDAGERARIRCSRWCLPQRRATLIARKRGKAGVQVLWNRDLRIRRFLALFARSVVLVVALSAATACA